MCLQPKREALLFGQPRKIILANEREKRITEIVHPSASAEGVVQRDDKEGGDGEAARSDSRPLAAQF